MPDFTVSDPTIVAPDVWVLVLFATMAAILVFLAEPS